MPEIINITGPVIYPLFALSFLGLMLVLERAIFFIKDSAIRRSVLLENLKSTLDENHSQPKNIRDELVSYQLEKAREPYYYGIRMLRVIAVVSPMVGLLGTVIGIISAFRAIAVHDGPVYPALIADGLWAAMITTAFGLIIALPCMVAAFIYLRMAEKRILRMESELNRHSLTLEGVKL